MLRITIESDGTPASAQATHPSHQASQAVDAADAGPGPGSGRGDAAMSNTAPQAANTGGPPDWLITAVTTAMAASQASYGSGPEGDVDRLIAGDTDGGRAPSA
jgi:hypothetical protein